MDPMGIPGEDAANTTTAVNSMKKMAPTQQLSQSSSQAHTTQTGNQTISLLPDQQLTQISSQAHANQVGMQSQMVQQPQSSTTATPPQVRQLHQHDQLQPGQGSDQALATQAGIQTLPRPGSRLNQLSHTIALLAYLQLKWDRDN